MRVRAASTASGGPCVSPLCPRAGRGVGDRRPRSRGGHGRRAPQYPGHLRRRSRLRRSRSVRSPYPADPQLGSTGARGNALHFVLRALAAVLAVARSAAYRANSVSHWNRELDSTGHRHPAGGWGSHHCDAAASHRLPNGDGRQVAPERRSRGCRAHSAGRSWLRPLVGAARLAGAAQPQPAQLLPQRRSARRARGIHRRYRHRRGHKFGCRGAIHSARSSCTCR